MSNVNINGPCFSPNVGHEYPNPGNSNTGKITQNNDTIKDSMQFCNIGKEMNFQNKPAHNSCSDSTRSSNPNNEIYPPDFFISNNLNDTSVSRNHNNDDTYEIYQLNVKTCSNDFLPEKSKTSVVGNTQHQEQTYKERTKYNKKKSTFYDNNTTSNSNMFFLNAYNNDHTDNSNRHYDYGNLTENKDNGKGLPQEKKIQHHSECDKSGRGVSNEIQEESRWDPDNLGKFRLGNNKESICGVSKEDIENVEQTNGHGKISATHPDALSDGSSKNQIQNNNEGNRLNMQNGDIDKRYEHFHMNRERAFSHTKIFDYVENDEIKMLKPKDKTNTFVPKYNNLSAKEIHFNSLAGNDSITILAANKMKLDLTKLPEKTKNVLPDVYPFHLSNDMKNENGRNRENKPPCLEKIYPTNFNYINTYNKNNADITLEERRHYMNSSHIFDCYDNKTEQSYLEKNKDTTDDITLYRSKKDETNLDNEKEEKRKLNPLYSDLFGRKTPDINQNVHCEKIMPTTLNCNWMYCPINSRKYSDPSTKPSDYLESYEKANFKRKSHFYNDVYDNERKKILQEAIQKGTRASLRVHLQSMLQDDISYNLDECNKVEVAVLFLHNIKDSVSDDQIKQAVKKSGAYVVSYQPEYDFLCNRRKSNAKLCIRYANGREGLNLLTSLFNELEITVQFM
ncbi:hypothetical protein, conserved [Plasmodium gonderi]|uniref:Uncharacterized protein n=1 Tax=Plasmodium gonderi TaxID=77519 RepID=A0A1Y1JFR7_PLAGO|nr:hypothetical protein, conserved [Plasmodium gonderi]GAW81336.1 hypothetical protein, conserved [Plasmodium gonderi]